MYHDSTDATKISHHQLERIRCRLKQRGAMLIWIDKSMSWNGTPSGKRGSSKLYSDLAIQFCLTIKSLYRLGLRQTEGMIESLIKLANLDWRAPDYSTLSKRQKNLVVDSKLHRL